MTDSDGPRHAEMPNARQLGLRQRKHTCPLASVLNHNLAHAAVIVDVLAVSVELGCIARQELDAGGERLIIGP